MNQDNEFSGHDASGRDAAAVSVHLDNPHRLSVTELLCIDQACLDFETQLRHGASPRIEDRLAACAPSNSLRAALLSELIALEIDYRQRRGVAVDRSEYERRFPGETRAIEAAFRLTSDHEVVGGHSSDVEPATPGDCVEVASRYVIQRFHAQGGLGVVYTATDESLSRKVAVKFPRDRSGRPTAPRRLRQEAAITGRLEHPGIVPVYAAQSSDDTQPFYVMKFVDGKTLHDAVVQLHAGRNHQPRSFFQSLAFRQMLHRLVAVCNTVAYAHGRNVIHRDIKPSNIMLGMFGETVLLDWGLAKTTVNEGGPRENPVAPVADTPATNTARLTEGLETGQPDTTCPARADREGESRRGDISDSATGRMIGTPEFASPEQIRGRDEEVSQASDIFSLGATLFFVLTSRPPGESSLPADFGEAAAFRRPRSPRQLQPALPRMLDAICRKAMAWKPAERYPSAQSMAGEIERFLADEPVTAWPETGLVRARRWLRKHPALSAALVVGILITALASIAGSTLLTRKNQALSLVNESLIRSNAQLVEARDAATEAKAQTIGALRTLTDQVIQRQLGRQTSLTDQDRRFLEQIKTDYQRFADLQSTGPESASIRAEGFLRVGQVQQALGQTPEAMTSLRKAIEWTSSVERPLPEVRRLAANAHGMFGELLVLRGEFEAADEELQRAIDLSELLADEFADEASYRLDVATWHTKLGNLLRTRNEYELACQAYTTSIALLDRLSDHDPENLDYTWSLACNHLLRGAALARGERLDDADREFGLALDLQQRVIDASPDTVRFQYDLSCVHAEWGSLCHRRQQFALAEEHFRKAIELLDRLVAMYPLMVPHHGGLIESHYRLARLYHDWNKWDEAERHFQRAVALIDQHGERYADLPEFHANWRNVYVFYARLLQVRGNYDLAEEHFRQGVRVARDLAESQPRLVNRIDLGNTLIPLGKLLELKKRSDEASLIYQQALAVVDRCTDEERRDRKTIALLQAAHSAAGKLYLNEGDLDSAAPHWRSVADLSQGPIALDARSKLAVSLASAEPNESLAIIESVQSEAGLSPTMIFNLACASGMVSNGVEDHARRDEIVQQTMGLLQRAHQEGYFTTQPQIDLLLNSVAFQSLRDREDYRILVGDLQPLTTEANK